MAVQILKVAWRCAVALTVCVAGILVGCVADKYCAYFANLPMNLSGYWGWHLNDYAYWILALLLSSSFFMFLGVIIGSQTQSISGTLSNLSNPALNEYDRRLKRGAFKVREGFIDNMESVRELQRAVTGEKDIYKWADSDNAYLMENHATSRAQAEWDTFRKYREYQTLEKALDKCIGVIGGNREKALDAMETHMAEKHGLERNRVFYVRDQTEPGKGDSKTAKARKEQARADFLALRARLSAALKSGKLTFRQSLVQQDEWITKNLNADYDPNLNDYSGISAFDPERKVKGRDVEWDESVVLDAVDDMEQSLGSERVRDLWDAVRAATDFAVRKQWEGGIITGVNRDKLLSMFDYYVPLRGFKEPTMESAYGDYLGHGGTGCKVVRGAKGRLSLSDKPMANIAQMAEASCQQKHQNLTKMALYRLATHHPSDALSLSKVWEVKTLDPVTGNETWQPAAPDITGDDTGAEVARKVQDFNTRMEQMKQSGEARLSHGHARHNKPFLQKLHGQQHAVPVTINGVEHIIYVNGDPRAAQAINGLVRNDRNTNVMLVTRALLNFVTMLRTSYSPEYIISNAFRITFFSNAVIASKENTSYYGHYIANYWKSLATSGNLYLKYFKGRLDVKNPLERMFKEFMDCGGRTNSVNARAELANRFAAFKTSREMGRSLMRSTADAKEISGNFNRQGAGSATGGIIGDLAAFAHNNFMLFNEKVQTIELIYKYLV